MNYHKQAIDILEKHKGMRNQLIAQIAKDRPSALVHALNSFYEAPWVKEVTLLLPENKIHAIKLCQELTGLEFKEAKHAVEAIKI